MPLSFLNCLRPSRCRPLALATAMALSIGLPVAAQTVSAPGSSIHLGGAHFDLGCTDWVVEGSLTLGAGGSITGVKNLIISATGSLDISGASVQLAEQFTNQGSLSASGGSISRVNSVDCPATGALGPISLNPSTPTITPVPSLDMAGTALLAAALALMGGFFTRRRSTRLTRTQTPSHQSQELS